MIRALLLFALMGSSPGICAVKTLFEQCQYFIDQKMWQEAHSYCRQAADYGHPLSQFWLGSLFYEGLGVAKSLKLAFHWWFKSAQEGNVTAQYNLGRLYQWGLGVSKNAHLALHWYQQAAQHQDAYAQHSLGVLYQQGLGVEQDLSMARQWYEKAANQGLAESQYNLAQLYFKHARDPVKAYVWLLMASRQGDKLAHQDLETLNTVLTPEQKNKALQHVARIRAAIIK